MGFLTGNFARSSDFNWSQELISVSHFASVVILYIDEVVPLIVED